LAACKRYFPRLVKNERNVYDLQADSDDESDDESQSANESEHETEEEARAKAEAEERDAIAAGKNKCPRCNRWVKDKIKNHLYKCWCCDRCGTFVTNKHRHAKACTGVPPDPTPKASKLECPVCGELVHPSSMIRHLKRRHEPEDVERQRKRTANLAGKTPKEQREARKRFKAAHPEAVSKFAFLSAM